MTEEEAKAKMCCGPLHFSSTDPNGQRCIASACMAWRWSRKANPDYREANIWPDARPFHMREPTVQDCENGGCGLAGAPQ